MARNRGSGHQAGANDGGRGDQAALGPDVLLGIWSTWMKSGAEQLTEHLAHDPLLKSIEQMWNANPLHEVIPLDWAGIAWALRTVWLRTKCLRSRANLGSAARFSLVVDRAL